MVEIEALTTIPLMFRLVRNLGLSRVKITNTAINAMTEAADSAPSIRLMVRGISTPPLPGHQLEDVALGSPRDSDLRHEATSPQYIDARRQAEQFAEL